MNAHILDQLSFESAEGGLLVEVHPEEALAGEVANPTLSKEFEDLQIVFDTYTRIVERGYVCRDDLISIKGISGEYPALERLFKRYPIASFTAEPSRVNYEVCTEGFIKTAYHAVINALREVIRYIVSIFRSFWKFLTENRARTRAVDDIGSKLKAIQLYLTKVEDVMASSRVSSEYVAWMRRGRDTALHNLNKKWNGLLQMAVVDAAVFHGYFESVNSVLRGKSPVFAAAMQDFIAQVKEARTEQDVIDAIAKMELTNMTSDVLTILATNLGYRPNDTRRDPRMTHFQAMAGHVRGVFTSLSNNRSVEMSREDFAKMIITLDVTPWSDDLDKTISWTDSSNNKALELLEKFSESDLAPGLEDAYAKHLTPFLAALTSVTHGFVTLERILGMMVAARNTGVISICNGALQTAKQADRFINANKNELTIAEKTVIHGYSSALSASFKE